MAGHPGIEKSLKKILIIQTAFLGDVVLATPLIEKARRHWPDAQIDFLLRKGNESLLTGHPELNEVIIRNKKEGKWKSLRKMVRRVRKERYDLVLNLHRYFSSGWIVVRSGANHIVGFDKNPFSWFYSHKVAHTISKTAPGVHEVERNLSLLHHLTDTSPDRMKLYPSETDFKAVAQTQPYVCIAPTSVWYSKQWPGEKWVALIQSLDPRLKVCILGAPGDFEACKAIQVNSGRSNVEVLAGKLSLLQSAALMRGARMNYVNDSAPMHLASSMNAPVTAVFLSTVPRFGFGPRSDQRWVVETDQTLPCRPCGLHGFKNCPKGHFKCADIPISDFPMPID